MRYILQALSICLCFSIIPSFLPVQSKITKILQRKTEKPAVIRNISRIPNFFIENQGQMPQKVRYYFNANNSIYFVDGAIVFQKKEEGYRNRRTKRHKPNAVKRAEVQNSGEISKSGRVVNYRLEFLGAKYTVPQARKSLGGKVNYFRGDDSSMWYTNIPAYQEVVYPGLYESPKSNSKGIDLVFKGGLDEIKYEFIVYPGADPETIRLVYSGIEGLSVDKSGNLIIHTALGDVKDKPPYVYQEIEGMRLEVNARFKLDERDNVWGFKVGDYDPDHTLIIDPGLKYSTFIGGSDEEGGWIVAVDSSGNAYIGGETYSNDFPTTLGAFATNFTGNGDIFVTKLDPTGSSMVYSTFIGGVDNKEGEEGGDGIFVDSAGNVYLTGWTSVSDFPTTPGAFDRSFNGGGAEFGIDAFVTKLDATGSNLLYSTFLGGGDDEWGNSITADTSGNAFVAGVTYSSNFPTTSGVFDTSHNGGIGDAFVTKLNPLGSSLDYSTFIGGSEWEEGGSIAIDNVGNAFLAGYTESEDFPTTQGAFSANYNGGDGDGYVTKLNPSGSILLYSTFLGGSNEDGCDDDGGDGIAVDDSGNAYVTGETKSKNFPISTGAIDPSYNGKQDAFVTKLDATGSKLLYSTFLGGSNQDGGNGIAWYDPDNIYVIGDTKSNDFPTTPKALDTKYNGHQDVFFAKLSISDSSLTYSTFLGGSEWDECDGLAIDACGNAYVTGWTKSPDFPTTSGAFDTSHNGDVDVFVSQFFFLNKKPNTPSNPMPPNKAMDISINTDLDWDDSKRATSYNVYFGTISPPPKVKTVINSIYKPGTLNSHTTYYWKIVAENICGLTSGPEWHFTTTGVIYSPLNFRGQKILNRSLSQAEYINELTWQANPNNENIVKYRIYRVEGNSQSLLVELSADIFKYLQRRVEKDKSYTYSLVAVTDEGREGQPTYLTII